MKSKSAKTTSARIFLALVVAAFVLAGCGGGSSDSSSSDATSPDSSGSEASSQGGPSGSGGDASSRAAGGAGSGSTASQGSGGGGSAAKPPSSGGKHGPAISLPEGEPEPGITPQQRKEATVASMIMQSPSSQSSSGGPQALPAQYTCDGKNTSPALRWQGVPPGTAELALFAMNIQPVDGKLFFDWAVAGLSPELEELEAGKLPKGAVVGRNSFGKTGYEICPESGGETYIFALFALPKGLSPRQGFEPLALRKAVTDVSGNVGLLALSYARG